MEILIATNILLLIAVVLMAHNLTRYRRRLHQIRLRGTGWPITTVAADEFHPVFVSGEFGPTLATEVRFVGKGDLSVPGGTSDYEAWILAVLAKDARRMFEFGTCTGKTTYLLARNSPPDAVVSTITLAAEQVEQYARAAVDSPLATRAALRESTFERFYYTGTDVEQKVEQLFGDSKAFDESPYHGACDLIFVDGSHAYSYVVSDSEKALRMLRPGGIVLWHDYRGPSGETGDVYRGLNELAARLPLVHIRGTSLVAYRAPER